MTTIDMGMGYDGAWPSWAVVRAEEVRSSLPEEEWGPWARGGACSRGIPAVFGMEGTTHLAEDPFFFHCRSCHAANKIKPPRKHPRRDCGLCVQCGGPAELRRDIVVTHAPAAQQAEAAGVTIARLSTRRLCFTCDVAKRQKGATPLTTATDTIHCDMCGTAIQPKRLNKDGLHYCGNACRQKAHRRKTAKAKQPSAGPTSVMDSNVTPSFATTPPPGPYPDSGLDGLDLWGRIAYRLEMPAEAAKAKPRNRLWMVEAHLGSVIRQRNNLEEKATRLEAEVRTLEQRYSETQEYLNSAYDRNTRWQRMFQDLKQSKGSTGLTAEEWAQLQAFSDIQLRDWAKVGAAMDRKGHDSPALNAQKWVVGNAQHLQAPEAKVVEQQSEDSPEWTARSRDMAQAREDDRETLEGEIHRLEVALDAAKDALKELDAAKDAD